MLQCTKHMGARESRANICASEKYWGSRYLRIANSFAYEGEFRGWAYRYPEEIHICRA